MTQELYIQAVIACLIGIVLQLLYKGWKIKTKAKLSNEKFDAIMWIKEDYFALIINVLSPFIVVYLIDEWLDLEEGVINKIKSIFVFVGFTGSSVIMGFLSAADKKFNKIIDNKTNIADGK